ncbi:hypothetical protein MVEN_01781900 [Mycena venus]|uniref:Uncharacterized protein n=1 Tax=Mycena venus TaxID=2733690 RepID=A0A8H6XNH0_9AGAR|nr:hypothetical protein MVEN_01781900 [Mycena venus]
MTPGLRCKGLSSEIRRKLLGNVELEDVDPTPKSLQRYEDWRTKLNRIDTFMQELEKRTAPKQTRPEPILPQIPAPPEEPEPAPPQQRASPPDAIFVPGEEPTSATLPADNLLFSVSDVARSSFSSSVSPPLTTLLPPSFPLATKSTTTAVEPRLLQHSNARQRDMADQMAPHGDAVEAKRDSFRRVACPGPEWSRRQTRNSKGIMGTCSRRAYGREISEGRPAAQRVSRC